MNMIKNFGVICGFRHLMKLLEGCGLNSLHILILIPFVFAIAIPFLHKLFHPKIHLGWFVLLIPLVIFLHLFRFIPLVAKGEHMEASFAWLPSMEMNLDLYVDGLGLLFGLLISGIGVLVIIYSIFYLSKLQEELHKFYVYLMMFMGAMLGLVFSDNIFILYGFWELTSVSSFLLIAFWYERKSSRDGALKALLITVFGGLCMFVAMIMLTLITDTYSIREMILHAELVQGHKLLVPVIICILLGAFTKSAQFPFSIWLPGAMEAPTPVSAYLHSATMVKAGIYLVARFTPVFGGGSVWFWLVSGIGIITLLYGSMTAVRQTDLKALLAYSTISQLGLIMSLLGIGSLAFYFGPSEYGVIYSMAIFAAIFHLFNHSMFKGSLFMVVGIIDHETGTRDIRRLGGLMQLMPVSFTVALIGSFSMAGLPPFNGFLSKEMFFKAANDVRMAEIFHLDTLGVLFPLLAWMASIFTFVYSMILVFKTFSGKYRQEKLHRDLHVKPFGMLIPPVILAFFVVAIFFFPNVFSKYLLKPAFVSILPPQFTIDEMDIKISAWHGWNNELLMTIGVVIIGSLLFITFKRWIPLFKRYPSWLTLNNLFEKTLKKVESYSLTLTNRYMTGSIRHYFIYIFSFFVFALVGSLLLLHGFQFDVSKDSTISIYDVGLVLGVMIAALTVLFTSNRITAIVALSIVGYLVTMFFVIFRAPDLALTQMVVETVTTVLFLLCFYSLPKLQKDSSRIKFKFTNLIVSIATGVTITILSLSSNSHKLFEPISYFFENAYELAGAKNIVNAILVDFRGFDTMLEISVLCIAGLGVYTLTRFRMKGRDENEAK